MSDDPARTPCFRTRPLRPSDAPDFTRVFEGLSRETRYFRFGAAKPRLSRREVEYLVAVDHHDHEALVALDCETGEAMAVARFVRLPDGDGRTAEIAVTVVDRWQGRRLAPALIAQLRRRAREEGIEVLRASVLPDNRRAVRTVRRLGFRPRGAADGMLTFELPLAEDAAAEDAGTQPVATAQPVAAAPCGC